MATHSITLAWRIPQTEEPGGLPSIASQRVWHDWTDLADTALPDWDLVHISELQVRSECIDWPHSAYIHSLNVPHFFLFNPFCSCHFFFFFLVCFVFFFLICFASEEMRLHYVWIPGRCLIAIKVFNRLPNYHFHTESAQSEGHIHQLARSTQSSLMFPTYWEHSCH